ncbi:hypothetical protein ZEAMMB73_Zm00001d031994 [Zea mays]|uniref:Uncharacterized protein n=1 Tax=Zea mays TaxID=4577 RepID=A0A1D6KMX2_MAIZE|nr:hypothetical protein ZEAMMB73_Zm00001d031994 [Zea mays]
MEKLRSLCACCMGPPRPASPACATAGVTVKVSDRYVSSPHLRPAFSSLRGV